VDICTSLLEMDLALPTLERVLYQRVQRFRGGLVFKARGLSVSLNSRLESKKEEEVVYQSVTISRWMSISSDMSPRASPARAVPDQFLYEMCFNSKDLWQ